MYHLTVLTLRLLIFCVLIVSCSETSNPIEPTNPAEMPYNVTIDPADFLSDNIIGNQFFALTSGKTSVYMGEDEKGKRVDIEETMTGQTKTVMGVTCVVVEFKEWVDGDLVEIAYDWYAQDNKGNVWYFGEDVEDYKNGKFLGNGGAWEAGVDGALPGIIMPANPIPGLWYRQEYYAGEAEDVGQILSLNETVTTPFGTFSGCLKTADWSIIEPGIVEHKYYAPGIGTVKIVKAEGDTGFEELVDIR